MKGYGLDLPRALVNLSARVGVADLSLLVTAVSIQSGTGGNLSEVLQATGSSSNQGNQFTLGTTVKTTDGQEYVYCLITTPASIYHWVGIDENFEAAPLDLSNARAHQIGVMQVSASTDQSFAWVAIQGHNLLGRVAVGCQPDVALYTATSATGLLDDATSTNAVRIDGVVAIGAATISASAVEVILDHPHAVRTPTGQ